MVCKWTFILPSVCLAAQPGLCCLQACFLELSAVLFPFLWPIHQDCCKSLCSFSEICWYHPGPEAWSWNLTIFTLAILANKCCKKFLYHIVNTNLLSIWEWMFCHRSLSWSAFSLCQSRSKSRSLCALNMRSLMTRAFCSSSSMSWNTSCCSSISVRHCFNQREELLWKCIKNFSSGSEILN